MPLTWKWVILVWFGLVLRHVNYCWLINTKSCFYILLSITLFPHNEQVHLPFQSYILDASRRSSVMQLSSSPISGYFCIISALTETLAWLWKSQSASVIAMCYARASTKAKKKTLIRPDSGRSYRHLSFRNSQWKTGHSTLLNYIQYHLYLIQFRLTTSASVQIILAADWFWTGPLQVLGSALAGSVVEARIWPSVSRCLGNSFGLRGPSPQAFTPLGEVGLIARRLRRP